VSHSDRVGAFLVFLLITHYGIFRRDQFYVPDCW